MVNLQKNREETLAFIILAYLELFNIKRTKNIGRKYKLSICKMHPTIYLFLIHLLILFDECGVLRGSSFVMFALELMVNAYVFDGRNNFYFLLSFMLILVDSFRSRPNPIHKDINIEMIKHKQYLMSVGFIQNINSDIFLFGLRALASINNDLNGKYLQPDPLRFEMVAENCKRIILLIVRNNRKIFFCWPNGKNFILLLLQ